MILNDPSMYFGNWSCPAIEAASNIFTQSFTDGIDSGKMRLFMFRQQEENFFDNMLNTETVPDETP